VLYWECKRRLTGLQKFRQVVETYFSESSYVNTVHPRVENEKSQQARLEINRRMGFADSSCKLSGFYPIISYGVPASENAPDHVNVLASIFMLNRFSISPNVLIDHLDRAIGYYEDAKPRLFLQLFNPFFWIKWLLIKVIGIPFSLLEAAGFDSGKLEQTTTGKIVKALWGFGTTLVATLAALQGLGWLDPVKKFIHSVFR
jgi:hypothetical protein